MLNRFQWLYRRKQGHRRPRPLVSGKRFHLLHLEERNSASALYGMEGLVLFSSGTPTVARILSNSNLPEIDYGTLSSATLESSPKFESGDLQNASLVAFSDVVFGLSRQENQTGKAGSRAGSAAFSGGKGENDGPLFLNLDSLKLDPLGAMGSGLTAKADSSPLAWLADFDSFRQTAPFGVGSIASMPTQVGGSGRLSASVEGFQANDGGASPGALAISQAVTLSQLSTQALPQVSDSSMIPQSSVITEAVSGSLESGSVEGSAPGEVEAYPEQKVAVDTGAKSGWLDSGSLPSPGGIEATENGSGDFISGPSSNQRLEILPEENVTVNQNNGSFPAYPNTIGSNPSFGASDSAIGSASIGSAMGHGVALPGGASNFGSEGNASRPDNGVLARITVSSGQLSSGRDGLNTSAGANGNHGSSSGASGVLESQTALFRINRVPGQARDLQVSYTLKSFDQESFRSIERTVLMPANQSQLLVEAGNELEGSRPEIVTLTVHNGNGYTVSHSVATRVLSAPQGGVSDGALLEAYRLGGSQDSFDTLVSQYWPGVFRTCHRILGQWADAEDVSQFVFLALTQLQVKFPSQISRWLNRVARNASIGLLRTKKRREKREQSVAKDDLALSHEADLLVSEEIHLALDKLPHPLKEAVSLRYLDGWSQQEAAQIAGCPRGTISQRAAHGIGRLKTLLSRDSA